MVKFIDSVIKLLTDSLLNCTNKDFAPPYAMEFLAHIETRHVVALIVGALVFLLTAGLFIVHTIFIGRYCNDFYRRAFVLFLACTPSFVSFCALVAMYMPRVWFLSYLLSFLYFSLAIYVTVALLLQLLDGRQSLTKKLHETNTFVLTRTPPFCCFFPCMPELQTSHKKIKYCEMMVMQTPLIRLFCTVLSLILYFEMAEQSFIALKILEFISLPSLLIGIYGFHILSNTVSRLEEISHTKYIIVFRLVDIYFMVFGLQTPIFELTARAGAFECGSGQLNALDSAYFWKNFAIIIESFVISIVSSLLLKPSLSGTGLFDKYNASCRSVSSAMSTTTTMSAATVESTA